MQNRHHAHSRADVMGIGSQLDDRISGGFDEQTVEVLLMQARKSPELMRQRKDHMIIRYRQEFLLPPLEPCLSVALVAFRATAITTGVIGILQPTAVITFKYMAPHGGRTASEYVLESDFIFKILENICFSAKIRDLLPRSIIKFDICGVILET